MRLLNVRLRDIAVFDDFTLDCSDSNGKPAPWVVLLGENGTGKSTLLQMIGAALLGYFQLRVIAGDVDWKGYIRNYLKADSYPNILINIEPETGDKAYDSRRPQAKAFLSFLEIAGETTQGRVSDSEYPELHSDSLTDGGFACGYGPWRRISRPLTGRRGDIPTLQSDAKPYRFASLFGDSSGLTDVPDWIAGLYFSSIHPKRTETDQKRFQTAKRAILHILPRVTALEVMSDRRVMVTINKTLVPIERLSDGYRGMLAWVGDLVRLFDAYPNSNNPFHERGVVLVDEIDLHLHPRWQRSVVPDIRDLFPNLQFIVTSHSPFIAQDLRPQDKIVVLECSKPSDVIRAREDSGALQDWSADQILSAYFGLRNGTRGEKALRDEARYQHLLEAEVAGALNDKTRKELETLRARMERIPIGETQDEQSFFRVADETIAALRRRREELQVESGRSPKKNGKDKRGARA